MDISALKKLRVKRADRVEELKRLEVEAGGKLKEQLDSLAQKREALQATLSALAETPQAQTLHSDPQAAAADPQPHIETNYDDIDEEEEVVKADNADILPTAVPLLVKHTEDKGRTLVATRNVSAGEVLMVDTSVLDIPSSVDSCLISSAFSHALQRFRAAAKAGKAVLPHEIKTKELESGVVVLTRIQKEGKDAEQGFDLAAVNVTGVQFRDGVLPVLVQYLESAQREGSACEAVFDLCCPIKDADVDTTAKYLALSQAFLQALGSLPQYQSKLTVDKAVRLLLIVQCNSVAVRRAGCTSLAVFPQLALIEHSCTPNATAVVLHKTGDNSESLVRVVANRNISAGEAISINYGTSYNPRDARQTSLKKSHFFTCACPRCNGQDFSRSFTKTLDSRYTPSTTLDDAINTLHTSISDAFEAKLEPPSVVSPFGDGAVWGGARELSTESAADNMDIARYVQAEATAVRRWDALQGDCVKGEWAGVQDWFASEPVLHPSHHVMMSVAVQCLPVAYRQGKDEVVLWLLHVLTLNNFFVEAEGSIPRAIASTLAEFCDVACRVCARINRATCATRFATLGEHILKTANHTDSIRHRMLKSTIAELD